MTPQEVWASRWPDAGVAVLVLLGGFVDFGYVTTTGASSGAFWAIIVPMTVAAGLARRLPAVSLGLVWVLALIHLFTSSPVGFVELAAVALVAFGVARWGSRATVVAAGVSIPAVLLLAVGTLVLGLVSPYGTGFPPYAALRDGAFARRGFFGALVLSLAVLGLPYLAGLAARSQAEADTSRRGQEAAEEQRAEAELAAEQAGEIARLREEQARLARDVHDVVGHSLAVILAQAESGQYLPDDPAQLKTTLATIATSARTSLQDVRQVLAAPGTPPPAPTDALETLVEGVRSGGREVAVDEVGQPRPLPPELETVAHRVLQEMLTNAVKHGRRDAPITVERHWPAGGHERDLRIEVANPVPRPEEHRVELVEMTQPITAVPQPAPEPGLQPSGQGIDGMRRRLESVGGRIDVRRRGETFTVTAWVPVRHD